MTLPRGVPENFVKSHPDTHVHVVHVDKARRIDDAERRGATHSTVGYQRGEAEPSYVSGSTTVAGSTSDAAVDDGVDAEGGLDEYQRRRRRPRDNQSIGKHLDIHIRGRDVHARTIAALISAFPHKTEVLRSIGKGCKEIIITGRGARAKVQKALRCLGGKVTHEP